MNNVIFLSIRTKKPGLIDVEIRKAYLIPLREAVTDWMNVLRGLGSAAGELRGRSLAGTSIDRKEFMKDWRERTAQQSQITRLLRESLGQVSDDTLDELIARVVNDGPTYQERARQLGVTLGEQGSPSDKFEEVRAQIWSLESEARAVVRPINRRIDELLSGIG